MRQLGTYMLVILLALIVVSLSAFVIVSLGMVSGYSQNVWTFWYLGLFSGLLALVAMIITGVSFLLGKKEPSWPRSSSLKLERHLGARSV